MKAVGIIPGKKPEIIDIQNELKPLQNYVGGYIETVYLPNDLILICNEEGKLWGMNLNFFLVRNTTVDEVVGPALFVKDCGDEFGPLDETEAEHIRSKIEKEGIWLI